MKFLCFLFLLYFKISPSVQAQKNNYLDGFIITLRNDTIAYSIEKRNWKKQPREIKVKTTGKDSVVQPSGIKGFIIPSLQVEYVSKSISPVRYIDKIQLATKTREPEPDSARFAFLKLIHNGSFRLYLFFDGLNRDHFFVEAPDNFLEIYSHYYQGYGGIQNNEPAAIPFKQYEFTLKVLMTPCRNIFGIIENIQFNTEQLKRLFEVYDKCIAAKKEQ
jgi:hypothetical protein